ncbi:MAG: NAD(P)-dependent oxidoreductase, partial [bacterium]|nr:NAD(P)-dependent oxidoreductase [bacterium]
MSEHVPPDLHSNAAWTKRSYLPLGIDVAGLRCLVVGGGRVGARKALTLTAAGATVTVLSPKICQRLREPVEKGTIRWEQATYSRTCLDSFFLVVAATSDPALNVRISREAKDRNILFCV